MISSSLGISRWKNMAQINDCGIRAASRYPDLVYWDYNWRKKGGSARMIEIISPAGFELFFRDVANVTMDLNDTEIIEIGFNHQELCSKY